MALFTDCTACQDGQHDGHVAVIKPPPRDGVGGDVCRCSGDCVERNLIWFVVRGNAAQMIPNAERAEERRALGYEVDGPMSAAQARSAVLGHRLAAQFDSPFECSRPASPSSLLPKEGDDA
jgi:hypothetical protein